MKPRIGIDSIVELSLRDSRTYQRRSHMNDILIRGLTSGYTCRYPERINGCLNDDTISGVRDDVTSRSALDTG